MNAQQAKEMTKGYDFLIKPTNDTINAIKQQAILGKLFLHSESFSERKTAQGVMDRLKDLGYRVSLTYQQNSPEDSNYYLHIDWE